MRHKLDLLGNAIDSLNEGLRQYSLAGAGDVASMKFAVLHVSHFVELLFKYVVAREHRLPIYKNPAARDLSQAATIGLQESAVLLQNANYKLDAELLKDVNWLKSLRNAIEHYQFDMDVREVRFAIGRIIRASNQFAAAANIESIRDAVAEDRRDTFDQLLEEYEERLAKAQSEACSEDASAVQNCSLCGEYETAVRRPNMVHCHFCGQDDMFEECALCSGRHLLSEMTVWNSDNPEQTSWASRDCEEYYMPD